MQDPTKYLTELAVTATSLFDKSNSAKLDPANCLVLNYETYLFANETEKSRFKADPTKYCGPLTDPVSLQRFVPIATSPHLEHNNRTYYFWSDSSRSTFAMMPEMYAAPHHKMRPNTDSSAVTAH